MGQYQVVRFNIQIDRFMGYFSDEEYFKSGNMKWAIEHFFSHTKKTVIAENIYQEGKKDRKKDLREKNLYLIYLTPSCIA